VLGDFSSVDFSATPHLDAAIVESYVPIDLPAKSPNAVANEFVDFWHTQAARNISSRVDPDNPTQIPLFAGKMTWGDPPSGYGYTQLMLALLLGLWDVFGIR
jgi:hypothetical protein